MAFSISSPITFHNPPTHRSSIPSKSKPTHIPYAIPPLSTDNTTLAVVGGGSVAALVAVLSLTDPEKRRQLQAEEIGGGDKEVVKEYFNNSGFQRWKKIYGETDDVNRVQLDIRIGHSKTVENVLKMLNEEGSLRGVTVCDAGCGTGVLSIPLAKQGALVSASDISAAMVAEAQIKVSLFSLSSYLLCILVAHIIYGVYVKDCKYMKMFSIIEFNIAIYKLNELLCDIS